MAKKAINIIIMALCELGIGVLLLRDPVGFTAIIFRAFGGVLAATGLVEIITYFRTDPVSAFFRQTLTVGLAEIAAGVFCILKYEWILATFPLLTMLYGVILLLSGFAKLQWTVDSIRMKQPKWFLAALSAVLTLAFAGVILKNPFTTTKMLWMFIAISLIVQAVFDLLVLIFRK